MTKSRRRARRDLPAPDPQFDHGSPHRLRKGETAIERFTAEDGRITTRAVVKAPTVLDAYHARSVVSDRQFEAGQHLAKLFTAAVQLPRVTANYAGTGGGSLGVWTDGGIDARQKLWRLLVHAGLAFQVNSDVVITASVRRGNGRLPIVGPIGLTDLGSIVLAVIGFDERAGDKRRLEKFRVGLDMLADRFGIPDPETPIRRKPRRGDVPGDAWMDPTAATTDNPEARDLSWAAEQAAERRRRKLAETVEGQARKGRKLRVA